MGLESLVACIPTMFMLERAFAPIENSPPGIHTIPLGASPGDGPLFGTVGPKPSACATVDAWTKYAPRRAPIRKRVEGTFGILSTMTVACPWCDGMSPPGYPK